MSNPIKGKTVCVTGTFGEGDRRHIERRIQALGGTPVKTVTYNTDILLVGAKPGSKLDQAKAKGVKIMQETEFAKIIRAEGGDGVVMAGGTAVNVKEPMPEHYGDF